MNDSAKLTDWELLYMGMKPDPENDSSSYLDIQTGDVLTIFEEEWQCYAAGWDIGINQKHRMLLASFPERYFELPICSSESEREKLVKDVCRKFGFTTK